MGSFASAFAFPLGGDPVAAVGDETVATFALPVEQATLTLEWRTDVMTAWSGKEQRHSLMAMPRQRYSFESVISDEQQRIVMATLAKHAPDGDAFLIGLPFEDLTITAVSGADVTVSSVTYCDWAVEGQRVVVIANDGTVGQSHIIAVAGAVLSLNDDLSSTVAEVGARIMPGMPSFVESTQSLSRYAVNAGTWTLAAVSTQFRYGSTTDLPGAGATLTEYEGFPVWDVGIQTSQASQPLHSGADMQDVGFLVGQLFRLDEAQWGRAIRFESFRPSEIQWLKLFLHTVRGRARSFFLPSGRCDLLPIGDASTGTLVVDDESEYADNWFSSTAHRHIKLVKADGTIAYREVTAAVDNGDGTQDLTLDSALAGALARVEFLEHVRLESDTATIQWQGGVASCDLVARVIPLAPADAASDYDDYEVSVQEGTPVELYTLETSAGTLYFTSSAEDVVFGADTYTAIPLSRSNVTPPRIGDGKELTITMPVDHAAAQDLLSNGIPQQNITLTIARIHSTAGSSRQIWRGNVIGATTDQQWLRITTLRDHDDTLSIQLPMAKGNRKCQHQLYDAGCKVSSMLVIVDIDSVSGTTIVLDAAFVEADGWANGGDIVASADDRRNIISQVGTTLTIDVPFRNVSAGTTVVVRAGCDKAIATCETKFNNVVNHGGHPQKLATKWMSPFSFGIRSRYP
jgi:uncharacterized phage protein (TIGR02218 family)